MDASKAVSPVASALSLRMVFEGLGPDSVGV
jgi:hypothetical protein